MKEVSDENNWWANGKYFVNELFISSVGEDTKQVWPLLLYDDLFLAIYILKSIF